MKKFQETIEIDLEAITAMVLIHEIDNLNTLATALYFGQPRVAGWILNTHPFESVPAQAASIAKELHCNKDMWDITRKADLFADGVIALMEEVRANELLGRWLISVFDNILRYGAAHGCDEALMTEVEYVADSLRG